MFHSGAFEARMQGTPGSKVARYAFISHNALIELFPSSQFAQKIVNLSLIFLAI